MDYQSINYNNDDTVKMTQILQVNGSDAINIEKFMTIIRGDIHLGLSLLMLFKQQVYEYLDNLNYALSVCHEEPHKLFEAAHAIKGASLSIAADKTTLLSGIIEAEIRDNNIVSDENYQNLIQATQELLNYITTVETRTHLNQ